jgi:peptidoglycan hydrolase-like protein with peptidoglycan-binding domain
MRKFITVLVGVGLVTSSILPSFASAQSLSSGLSKLQELMAQVQQLQAQIRALQQQQVDLQVSANAAILEIIQGLKEGNEGDQVTLLQTLLAADAAIYPEGKVTGFFGPLTRRALQRFQAKHGLEQVGFVGPRTRAELNKLLREHFKEVQKLEDEVDDEIADAIEKELAAITLPPLPSDPCGIPSIPSGGPIFQKDGKTKLIQTGNVFIYQDGKHKIIITPNTYHEKDGKKQLLITPGMRIEKDGKSKVVVPCNGGTTTPPSSGNDTTPPSISDINASPSQTSATVVWKTNEDATGKVYYGTTNPLNLSSAQSVVETNWWWFNNLSKNHSVSLTGLSASTTYYFVVESKDKKGNTATSSQQSFVTTGTTAPGDTTPPNVTAISSSNVSTSTATVSWTTNENADSKVYYSTATPLSTSTASTKTDGAMVTSHSLGLTGLTPNTTYYYKVESTDAAGNKTLSSETSFNTQALPPADTTPPTISAVNASPASTTATVSWTTNEAATSKVYYGTATPLVLSSASTVTDGAFLTSHSLGLTNLATSTTYYVVVESADAATNAATSSEFSFTTGN